jgi:hypothetical protein
MKQQWDRDKRQANPDLYNSHSRAKRARDPEKARAYHRQYHAERLITDPEDVEMKRAAGRKAARKRRAAKPSPREWLAKGVR